MMKIINPKIVLRRSDILNKNSEKVKGIEMFAMLPSAMLGVSILNLPMTITIKTNSPDGWFVVLLTGLFFLAFLYVLNILLKKHNVQDYYEYLREGYGKWFSNVIILAVVCYFLFITFMEISTLSKMTTFYLLEHTPKVVIMLMFILVSSYLLTGGIQAIAKISLLYLPITICIMLMVFFFSLKVFDINQVKPFLGQGILPLKGALIPASFCFSGLELYMFYYGSTIKSTNTRKLSMLGFLIALIIYILTCIIVIGVMSVPGVQNNVFPTIDFLNSFEVTGIFFERLNFFFLGVWTLQIFITYAMFHFFAVKGLVAIFRNSFNHNVLFLVPILFLGGMFLTNQLVLEKLLNFIFYMFLFTLLVLPLLTFFLVSMKRRKEKI